MRKAIIVLVMIIGIFTSCEQENILYDCNCVERVHEKKFNPAINEMQYIITKQRRVDCQKESRIETEGIIIEVKCGTVTIIK